MCLSGVMYSLQTFSFALETGSSGQQLAWLCRSVTQSATHTESVSCFLHPYKKGPKGWAVVYMWFCVGAVVSWFFLLVAQHMKQTREYVNHCALALGAGGQFPAAVAWSIVGSIVLTWQCCVQGLGRLRNWKHLGIMQPQTPPPPGRRRFCL